MRFFYTALLAGALAAMAAEQNGFTIPTIPATISAGTTFNITWSPTTQGTISLLLTQANSPGSTIVHTVSTIAGKIANSGAFAWFVDSSIPKGAGYALEIVSDSNPNSINYSLQFAIDSPTSPTASGSGSASASGSSASASGSAKTTVTVTSSGSSSAPSAITTGSRTGNSTFTFTTTLATTATTTAGAATTTATSTSKNAAALETARAGMGLLAFVGAAVLVL